MGNKYAHYVLNYAAVTIGIERTEYFLPEGSTFDLCVVLTGAFDESPSITANLTSLDFYLLSQ